MAPPTRVQARVRPRALHEEAMEGFHDTFDHRHKLIVCGERDSTLCHKVANDCHGVTESERKHHRGTPHGVLQREGEATRVLPRPLGSKGDTRLVLKPPVVEADGGKRLDGGVSQHQLSSHRDDEV